MFPWYIQWAPNAIWKTFDLFVGLIQAFIFSLLTILYFSQSMELDHDHEDETRKRTTRSQHDPVRPAVLVAPPPANKEEKEWIQTPSSRPVLSSAVD